MNIEQAIKKYPRLSFLKTPLFLSLPAEKREFLVGCIEDAIFWEELEEEGDPANGFKFLAAHYGLEKAKEEATAKGLTGKAREDFLKPIHDLYLMFNPKEFGSAEG